MTSKFRIIVITQEEFAENEAELCTFFLRNGVDALHIRKPHSTAENVENLLKKIPADCHSHIVLHDHFGLAAQYHVGGIHLNNRNPHAPANYSGTISYSCHSLTEIAENKQKYYCFLSPIYDSISKVGYKSNFEKKELHEAKQSGILTDKCIALGGVTPKHIPELIEMGFGGAAFLGYAWRNPERFIKEIQICCNL